MSSRNIVVAAMAALFAVAGCGSIEESEPKPRLEATGPAGTAFGDTLVGTRKLLEFQLRNSDAGLAKVKTLENIAISVEGNNGLSMIERCPTSLDEGDACTITLTYAPAVTGTLAATLRVTSNAETVSLAITGTAEDPLVPAAGVLAFTSSTNGDFGSVRIGNSVARTYVVKNIGNLDDALTVAAPNVDGWKSTNDCPASLPVDASCNITVVFGPTESVDSTPSPLTLTDAYNNDYGGLTISLKGTGR